MLKSTIENSGFRVIAALGATLLLAGCGSKAPESAAPEPANAVSNALAGEVEEMEKEVRLKGLEQRLTDLEQKLGEVEAKQEINDAMAKPARDKPPLDAGTAAPAPE